MHIILRFLYIILSYLLVPLVLLHLFWKGFGNRDYWKRIPERFGWFSGPGYDGVIWVHGADRVTRFWVGDSDGVIRGDENDKTIQIDCVIL